MQFRFGIEHEVAFLNQNGQFADYTNTSYNALAQIVAELPVYDSDYPQLRVGDGGIKHKRWYVEGFERFEDSETPVDCPPKGIEIRTTIHSNIAGAVAELCQSFDILRAVASRFGYTPIALSFNPIQTKFWPDPPLNDYELARRTGSPEMMSAHIPMLTYGPDLNISLDSLSTPEMIDLGRKLTAYSPFIIPFSFSSPFYDGQLWAGLSIRTYVRTGVRPAALVFVDDESTLLESNPTLTEIARVEAEIGRIEFKACDSCRDFSLYGSLLALLKGLCLDQTLPDRATVPDASLHQHSAKHGFESQSIFETAQTMLHAAAQALAHDPDRQLLEQLWTILKMPKCSEVYQMRQRVEQGYSVADVLPTLCWESPKVAGGSGH